MNKSIEAKGLAYVLCRELIEDAHAEYKISDDEMKRINKRAVNRASLLMRLKEEYPKAYETYLAANAAVYCKDWDEPEEDEEVQQIMEALKAEGLLDQKPR